jgi:hypothetical protein
VVRFTCEEKFIGEDGFAAGTGLGVGTDDAGVPKRKKSASATGC